MPVNVNTQTTAPITTAPEPMVGVNSLPLLAYQPHYLHDFMVGGFTIDASTIPTVNGKKMAYAGDVFRSAGTGGPWALCQANDDGTAPRYVMLPHNRDCTNGNQSSNGLLRSQHVNRAALMRPIPAALVGGLKLFQYSYASPVDLRG